MDELDYVEADARHNAGYPDTPILPYAETSGWSGSVTSKERAVRNDKNGTTRRNQRRAWWHVTNSGSFGITWKELSEATDWHHGTASGVLSVLDKAGEIVRLKEKRNRCAIYVSPDSVFNREIAVRKPKSCKHCGGQL